MHTLLAKTWQTCKDIAPFGVLVALFVFIFAILGMQVRACEPALPSR